MKALRKNYVNDIYAETMNKIRSNTVGHKIWVSADEMTDIQDRYMANINKGTSEVDRPDQVDLLNSEVLEETIIKFFDRSMFLLWPEGKRHDDVLLFLSDYSSDGSMLLMCFRLFNRAYG